MVRRGLRRLGYGLIGGVILLAVSYGATFAFLGWRETVSPSTSQILVLRDGQQIPLVQPTAAPGRVVSPAPPAGGDSPSRTGSSSAAPRAPAPRPPLRLQIPRLSLDWPVVLSDNDHLPRFQGVGWLLGSAFPGAAGNMVLVGHLDGRYATFARLHELQPGDHFIVATADSTMNYRVLSLHPTRPDDVAVLAPTSAATATLITCSGPWDAGLRMYEQRLIVSAAYEAAGP